MKSFEKNMSHTPNEIIFHRNLNDDEKILLGILYGFKPKQDGDTFPGQDTLASIRGCTEKTIGRKLDELVKKGMITRTRIKNRKYHYTFKYDNKDNFTIIPMSFLADVQLTDEEKIAYVKIQQLSFTYAQGGNQYIISKLGMSISKYYAIYGRLVELGYLPDNLPVLEKEKPVTQIKIEQPAEVKPVVTDIIQEKPENIISSDEEFYGDMLPAINEYMKLNKVYNRDEAYRQMLFTESKKESKPAEYLVNCFYKKANLPINFANAYDWADKVKKEIDKYGYHDVELTIDYLIEKNKKSLGYINKMREEVISYIERRKAQLEYQQEKEEMDMRGQLQAMRNEYDRMKGLNVPAAKEKMKEIEVEYPKLLEVYKQKFGGNK